MHKAPSTCKEQSQHVICFSLAAFAVSQLAVCICHALILCSLHH